MEVENEKNEVNETVHMDENGGLVIPESAMRKPITPDPTIFLADGSEYKGSAAINASTNDLWLWINGTSMSELFPVFSDPTKTNHIETKILETDEPTVYEGYVNMNVIKVDYQGQVSIRLTK